MNLKRWLQIAFLNLTVVAAIGVILRYKIAFSFPFVDQKHLLHGHSHFAFCGWVTQALMALIIYRISAERQVDLFKRYSWILWGNLICAYGMLVSFPIQGYGLFSITFSTGSILLSYCFAVYLWKDISKCEQKKVCFSWFKAGALFNAISSIGAFALSLMMATKTLNQNWYLAAVYFFLHFQYNGWFMFAILGLLFERIEEAGALPLTLRSIFRLFAFACVPAYFLSALWMPMPNIVYIIVVLSAFIQVVGWVWTINIIRSKRSLFKQQLHSAPYLVITLSLVALTIKLLLQLGSTIPSLSTLTFGFRPIVIGYLHLVLLGVVSLFILGYSMSIGVLDESHRSKLGISIFISGIVLNEIALMVQGAMAIGYIVVPYINETLLAIAVVMFFGVFLLNQRATKRFESDIRK
jgi:hypothetical protein